MRSKRCAALLVSLLCAASAAEAAVLRVVVVESKDPQAYADAIEKGRTLMARKGITGKIRVWRGRFAGDRAGSIVSAAEYASLEELAKAETAMASDPELAAWLASLAPLRTIVSDSIYTELTE